LQVEVEGHLQTNKEKMGLLLQKGQLAAEESLLVEPMAVVEVPVDQGVIVGAAVVD
jgi:hypothetical protein